MYTLWKNIYFYPRNLTSRSQIQLKPIMIVFENELHKLEQIHNSKARSYYAINDTKSRCGGKKTSYQNIYYKNCFNAKHSEDEKLKFDMVTMMEDLKISGISDPAAIIKSASLLDAFPIEHVKHELEEDAEALPSDIYLKKTSEKLTNVEHGELSEMHNLQIQAQKENLVRTLNAYLRVCIACGMIGRAYHTIIYYRKQNTSRLKSVVIRDVTLYNILLQAYASQGNLVKVKEFIKIIHEDKLEMTLNTYAAVFECFGNLNNPSKDMKFLSMMKSDMLNKNITFDDVLRDSKSRFKQYDNVLRGIRLLDSSFEPTIVSKNYSYDCNLLRKIVWSSDKRGITVESQFVPFDFQNRLKQQIHNEIKGHVQIQSIEKFERTKLASYYKQEIVRLESNWEKVISNAFDRDLKALKNREHKPIPNAMVLYPCLSVLDKHEYINAILCEIRKLADGSETYSPSLLSLCRRLGKYINDKYELLERINNGYINAMEKVYMEYNRWYTNRKSDSNSRIVWSQLSNQLSNEFTLELELIQWPVDLQISVGKFLYDIILKDIKLNVNCVKMEQISKRILPAFYTLFRSNSSKHLIEEIKPHPILAKIYRESQPETLTFETSLIPLECPPRPWTSIRSGGYLLSKTDIIRLPLYLTDQSKRLSSAKPSQLWPALDSLNQLGSIPWAVNKPILDLVIDIFRNGGCAELNVPQSPSVLTPVPLLSTDSTESYRKAIIKSRIDFKRKKNEMFSLWCDMLYRLSLANHFRDKVFWLPHNMDFRGRVYPVPPHLNHLGSDLARSILIFAIGKPLGPNGLNWLKIHAINLTGLKKRESLSERLRYANEVLDEILESAENPMSGRMWWKSSEDPWQTLATCKEIAAALKTANPEEYICRFPIHQDGSCNGLQHYAALGRDQVGAESVNLYPSEKPQDVYTSVASQVDKIRLRDANEGIEIAKVLENFVKRKIIKQTVMTTVYGVTKFGARLQIARQLKDLENFPQEYVWSGSLYLAQKTFESLRTMFESAKKIQDWFTDCARVISKIKGQNLEWITPLGLHVVQPYCKVTPSKSSFKNITIDYQKPNTSKQKNAFAPNFIHSLDSSHMMLTSLHCENAGITFVSVHDCFWTHPCTVEAMNKICREQFVALHSEPILENLSKFLVTKYINTDKHTNNNNHDDSFEKILVERKLYYTLSNVPIKGTFNLEKILDSTYFFS